MKLKKTISLILIVIMTFTLFVPIASAAPADVSSIYFDGGVSEGNADHIKLITNPRGEGYCLYLPSTVSSEELTVNFNGSFSVDGTALTSGEATDAFASKQAVSAVINGTGTTITVYQSTLPSVFVTTASGSFSAIDASKENKEKGTITVADSEEVYYDGALKQIKGRGNETWNQPKKPYNFKFDSGVSLLGMEEAKDWCLIASYIDNSFLRNPIASELGAMFEVQFAPETKPVVLYRNGQYNGVYLLTEKVEIDKNRVNITNLEKLTEKAVGGETDLDTFPRGGATTGYKAGTYKYIDIPSDPADITGGYLLELELRDRYPGEISGFVSNRGMSVVIKEPEYASKAQVEYIRNYFQSFEDALFAPDGRNSQGKHYSEYIDVQSFADLYVLNDVLVNFDTCITSAYLYKDAGDVMYSGPIWD